MSVWGPEPSPPVSVRVGSVPLLVGGCSCACLWRVGGFLFVSVRDPVCFLCVYVTWRVPACQRLRVFPRVGWRLWVCPHVCHGDSRHMMAFRGCVKCGYLNGGGLEAETATAMLASLFCHYIVSKSEREDLSAFFPSPSEAPGPYQHGPRAPSPRPLGWPDLCSSAPPALVEATSTPPSDLRPSQPPQHHRSPHPPPHHKSSPTQTKAITPEVDVSVGVRNRKKRGGREGERETHTEAGMDSQRPAETRDERDPQRVRETDAETGDERDQKRQTQTQEAEAGKRSRGGRAGGPDGETQRQSERLARETEGQSTAEPKSQGPSCKENRES